MQAENFTWLDSIHLKTGDVELDLHNCYDFQRLSYDVVARTVELWWRRGQRAGMDETLPGGLQILLSQVHYVRFEPRDPEQPFTEDDCLASFGYDSDEDWRRGQFWVEATPEAAWRWSFLFQSGAELVVGAKRASVTLRP